MLPLLSSHPFPFSPLPFLPSHPFPVTRCLFPTPPVTPPHTHLAPVLAWHRVANGRHKSKLLLLLLKHLHMQTHTVPPPPCTALHHSSLPYSLHRGALSLAGAPSSKADVLRRRLHLLLARTARHRRFAVPLLPLGSAAAAASSIHRALLLPCKSPAFLAPPHCPLFLAPGAADASAGAGGRHSGVAAEAASRGGLAGVPPVEPREEALSLAEGLDLFGAGPSTPTATALLSSSRSPLPPVSIAPPAPPHEQAWVQQREAEEVAEGHMFIVMADIALHDPQTLSRLATLLGAYDAVNDPPRLFSSLPFTPGMPPCCLPLPSPLHHLCMCVRQTLQRLAPVLGAYDALDEPPRLFLLIGDLCSPPSALASPHLHAHREAFSQLARVIGAHRRLKDKSLFVFVPGQADPGGYLLPLLPPLPSPALALFFCQGACQAHAQCCPRPSLPRFFTDPITDALPSAVFSSNPSRLKFYSQELVVLRADLQRRMQRCAVLPPLKDTDPFTHVSHTHPLTPAPLAMA
ncbi:unnamed protein product [Closterium sp. NIES-64]|nr:unnamed protein product [Closterium sp. NIES-64]